MEDFDASFNRYGGLHDCTVLQFCFMQDLKKIEIKINDIWANFAELPEYPGPQAAIIVLTEIKYLECRLAIFDQMNIFDVENSIGKDGLYMFSMKLWPEGSVKVKCGGCECFMV